MAARPLSERETLPYLVIFVALSATVGSYPYTTFDVWDALSAIYSVSIAVLGTVFIYRQNGAAAGRDFLQRYLAVGWVVALRCFIAITAVFIGYMGILDALGILDDTTRWLDTIFIAVSETIIYWRIGHHVRDLAHRTKTG